MSDMPEVVKNKLGDFMRRLSEHGSEVVIEGENGDINTLEELLEPQLPPPLERAIMKAIDALKEIEVYGAYGKGNLCVSEAEEALAFIEEMRKQDRAEKGLPEEDEPVYED